MTTPGGVFVRRAEFDVRRYHNACLPTLLRNEDGTINVDEFAELVSTHSELFDNFSVPK